MRMDATANKLSELAKQHVINSAVIIDAKPNDVDDLYQQELYRNWNFQITCLCSHCTSFVQLLGYKAEMLKSWWMTLITCTT